MRRQLCLSTLKFFKLKVILNLHKSFKITMIVKSLFRCLNSELYPPPLVCCAWSGGCEVEACKERERGEGARRTAFSRLHLIVKMQ